MSIKYLYTNIYIQRQFIQRQFAGSDLPASKNAVRFHPSDYRHWLHDDVPLSPEKQSLPLARKTGKVVSLERYRLKRAGGVDVAGGVKA